MQTCLTAVNFNGATLLAFLSLMGYQVKITAVVPLMFPNYATVGQYNVCWFCLLP